MLSTPCCPPPPERSRPWAAMWRALAVAAGACRGTRGSTGLAAPPHHRAEEGDVLERPRIPQQAWPCSTTFQGLSTRVHMGALQVLVSVSMVSSTGPATKQVSPSADHPAVLLGCRCASAQGAHAGALQRQRGVQHIHRDRAGLWPGGPRLRLLDGHRDGHSRQLLGPAVAAGHQQRVPWHGRQQPDPHLPAAAGERPTRLPPATGLPSNWAAGRAVSRRQGAHHHKEHGGCAGV